MQDKEIISLYLDRDEKAIEYTEQKYRAYCLSVADRILSDPQDCEECLNDVWLAAWESIPPNDPPALAVYLGRIARNISVRRQREMNRKKRGAGLTVYLEELSEALPGGGSVEELTEGSDLRELIGRFLKAQSRLNRDIFVFRYYYLDSIADVGRRFGMTDNQVKLRLFRLRKKLKGFLGEPKNFLTP